MSFLRDNALFVVIGWLAFGFLVALWFSRMAAHGAREVPTVYDQDAHLREANLRNADFSDGFQGSEAHVTGHGAHYDRWGN